MNDLRKLRYFVACAEELHFTRAAKRLGIAQPPLSQQIKLLEQELGTRLFERSTRGMELTLAGASLLEDARQVISATERAYVNAQRIGRGEAGSVRLGFTGSIALNSIVPRCVATFRGLYPLVDISLVENTTKSSLRALNDGVIDVALIRPAADECDGLHATHLIDEQMFVAVSALHPLATKELLSLSVLRAEPFVLYPRNNGRALYDVVVGACQQHGFVPEIVQEAPQMVSTVSLVAAGIGVTLVPESMRQLHASGVKYIPIEAPSPIASIHLVRRERPVPIVLANFCKEIIRIVKSDTGDRLHRSTSDTGAGPV